LSNVTSVYTEDDSDSENPLSHFAHWYTNVTNDQGPTMKLHIFAYIRIIHVFFWKIRTYF